MDGRDAGDVVPAQHIVIETDDRYVFRDSYTAAVKLVGTLDGIEVGSAEDCSECTALLTDFSQRLIYFLFSGIELQEIFFFISNYGMFQSPFISPESGFVYANNIIRQEGDFPVTEFYEVARTAS